MSTEPAAAEAATFAPHPGLMLACLRAARGWPQPQLAQALGWSTARFVDMEEGRERLGHEQLHAALQVLGLKPWALNFAAEYLQDGGRVPQGTEVNLRWQAFVIGLEVAQVLSRIFVVLKDAPHGEAASS